jgi:hypothetical protein
MGSLKTEGSSKSLRPLRLCGDRLPNWQPKHPSPDEIIKTAWFWQSAYIGVEKQFRDHKEGMRALNLRLI